MCGAGVVQVVSAVLREGLQVIESLRRDMASWMQEHEYESLAQMRGSMNLKRCPNPAALSRLNYVHTIRTVFPQLR
jgi:dihydroorotate dehydrogenase (fumarate)